MPAATPARNPTSGMPLACAAPKPAAAATSIMPSMPRFTTPLFSLTTTPVAANSSGVPALSVAATSDAISFMPQLPSERAGRRDM